MTSITAPNINLFWSRLIVEELLRQGITRFAIAPGSRSAPLAIAAAEHPQVQTILHFDERGLAFYAMGATAADGEPLALICTSGTAVANLLPAVIEAGKKKLPLILLTADRPPELRATGANQTIDQPGIFGRHVRFFFDLPCPTETINPRMVLTTVDQAVYLSRAPLPGPVHLNCMFREPLSPDPDGKSIEPLVKELSSWGQTRQPFTRYLPPEKSISKRSVQIAAERLDTVQKGVIVVGKLKSPGEAQAVIKLAERLQWPVFPDLTSGLRVGAHHPLIIHYFDQILQAAGGMERQAPFSFDGVLHIGGRMTSRAWSTLVEQVRPREYLTVLNHPLRNDPGHTVTLRLEAPPGDVCTKLARRISRPADPFNDSLKSLSDQVGHNLDDFFKKEETITEPGVARLLSQNAPRMSGLFVGNSMPIRDLDAFADPAGKPVVIGANRGASGIDGTLAAAAGFARALDTACTALLGDLAVLHDLNSLALLREHDKPFVLVTINNDGGGIFSFLPVARQADILDPYFSTPHGRRFAAAAQMFGLEYARPENMSGLRKAYRQALQRPGPTLIEITTDREHNRLDHERLREHLHRNIAQGKGMVPKRRGHTS